MFRTFSLPGMLALLMLMATFGVSHAQGLQIYGLRSTNPQSPITSDMELVKLDPFTVNATPLYTIPQTTGVSLGSSTYDQDRKRYIFWGRDDNGDKRFYSASVDSPQWTSPLIQGDSPKELQYDLQDDVLYGLKWEQSTQTEYLVTVDLQTGQVQNVAALPGVESISAGTSTFNSNHHRYMFVGKDTTRQKRLYYVDALTGQILSQAPLSNDTYYRGMQYDLNTNQLYTIWTVEDTPQANPPFPGAIYTRNYLATVDTATGQASIVNQTPLLEGFTTGILVSANDFDQMTSTYLFVGSDDTSARKLRLVDVTTGSTYSAAPFSSGLVELECDNQIFARMAYGSSTSNKAPKPLAWKVYPNPTSDRVTVQMDSPVAGSNLALFDAMGRQLIEQTMSESTLSLSLSEYPKGVYWLRIADAEGVVATEHIVRR